MKTSVTFVISLVFSGLMCTLGGGAPILSQDTQQDWQVVAPC